MESLIQMRFVCPQCSDETWVVVEQISPIMVRCQGCSDILILQDGTFFTVSKNFFKKRILKRFSVSECGKVINHIKILKPLPATKIVALKEILKEDLDVLEFLDKI